MKRQIKYILITLLLAVCACSTELHDKAGETAPFRGLHRFDNDTRLMVKANALQSQQVFYYILQFVGTTDAEDIQWYEEVRALDREMYQQAQEIGVDGMLTDILYASLSELSITANQEVFGRKSGEELADLFHIGAVTYQFTYPEGKLVVLDKNKFEIGEWIDCGYMCTKTMPLYLNPNLDFTQLLGDIEITIKTTFKNRTISDVVTTKDIAIYTTE